MGQQGNEEMFEVNEDKINEFPTYIKCVDRNGKLSMCDMWKLTQSGG